jgi:glutaconate CoA-transferase subunit B
MEPDAESKELTVTSLHPGVSREQVEAATAWRIRFAPGVSETPMPSALELEVLRAVRAATAAAHANVPA